MTATKKEQAEPAVLLTIVAERNPASVQTVGDFEGAQKQLKVRQAEYIIRKVSLVY